MSPIQIDPALRTLSLDEIEVVTGGAITGTVKVGSNVVMRPDGGTCTDPFPLPPKGPYIPQWPFPKGPILPF